MKKTVTVFLGLMFLVLAGASVQAEPIMNNMMSVHKAGWYPNNGMACPDVCKQLAGTVAEQDASMCANSQRTHVCKFGNGKQFLYGNQFDANPVCYTAGLSQIMQMSRQFLCLCVGQ